MKFKDYTNIINLLNANTQNTKEIIDRLSSLYPDLNKYTLRSILDRECQKRSIKLFPKHSHLEKMNEYYFRYCEESQQHIHKHVILTMAAKINLPPALMARIILDRHLAFTKFNGVSPQKSDILKYLKDPSLIDDADLSYEIESCLYADDVYGPISDTIKHCMGHEFEIILKNQLDSNNIPYQDEKTLRSRGFDKTPDSILQIPIVVDGKIVNWIESKASFGDPENHKLYLKDQLWSYWNRFGAGMVIYWFGFVDELNVDKDKGIIIMDHFPEKFETINFFNPNET